MPQLHNSFLSQHSVSQIFQAIAAIQHTPLASKPQMIRTRSLQQMHIYFSQSETSFEANK
jgi:hypothetical protein